jgi:protein ImuB
MFASIHAPGNLPILLGCARQFSPLIEITSPDTVTFDIRGLAMLHGPPANIAQAIERVIGIPTNIAVAANADTAARVAQGIGGTTVVAPGQEARALAPLPLNLLGCPSEMGATFELWGIHSFGQFAGLPPFGVAARLGAEGAYWQRIAQGAVQRQLRLVDEKPSYAREMQLEDRILLLEPLLFLLSRFLGELCRELASHSLAANEVRLRLGLEREQEHAVTLRLPAPMTDPKALLKLLQLELSEQPPRAAVCKIRLELEAARPRRTQEDLFAPAYPAPEKIDLTIARIRHLVGSGNIGSPRILDTHRPDSFVIEPFRPAAQQQGGCGTTALRLAFRRFRPPERAEVTLNAQPVHVVSPVARGAVEVARGPWFSSGNWWRTDSWDREEWDIALRGGALYRIFRDSATQRWFVEGNYD